MMEKYYKTGEFAKMASLSIRTIRYYDSIGLLKPSRIGDNGYRYYTDKDFLKLQKIISLKSLGFSLDEIFSMTVNDSFLSLQQSLSLQKTLINQKIESLKLMKASLQETENYIMQEKKVDWSKILHQINYHSMEQELIKQYKDSTNLDIRIRLHEMYSTNPMHWFDWLYSLYSLPSQGFVLEIGCGNGVLWKHHCMIPECSIVLSDTSQGMIEDAQRNLQHIGNFQFQCFDCHHIPYDDESCDVVIANHMLFYVQDLKQVLNEVRRVLKKGGFFYCSTYGKNHMKEITELVKEFNPKMILSDVSLYDSFGLENGYDILSPYFENISVINYEDDLLVDNPDDLTNYILSCHGNQIEYIMKDLEAFQTYMTKKVLPQIKITKEAGCFICCK